MRSLFALAGLCAFALPLGVSAALLAQFRTPVGEIDVELYDQDKPATVANFVRYVRQHGYTNDMIIHRWEPNFVIQGGAIFVADRSATNSRLSEIHPFPEIPNEYSVGRTFSNLYGTIAMARRSGETNSASSQWFFNLKDNVALDGVDGGFTVFGRVVRGTNVLNIFNLQSTNSGIYSLNYAPGLTKIPVIGRQPTWDDFIFVDISLLDLQVARNSAGLAEISWRSVTNKLNRVEYTTQFPPVWSELAQTNGTGSRLTVVDVEPGATNRFYRVRVEE